MKPPSPSLLLSVVIATVVVFQSAIVAPVANVALSSESAALFLRFIWPIFFGVVGGLGLFGLLVAQGDKRGRMTHLFTLLSMIICYALVSTINAAMDSGNLTLWKRLHMLTVGLTLLSLILHLTLVFKKRKT
tara:strand:+ start:5745 stop:6140 length:396 start_codon:yes stop_codon:yes gene_type:complete